MQAPRNVIGRPVMGADFFDRDDARKQLWRLLQRHHVLLLAPRRVGKTSVLRQMVREAGDHGVDHAVYLSAADVKSEAAFVAKVFAQSARGDDDLRRALMKGRIGRGLARIGEAELPGVKVAMHALPEDEWELTGEELGEALHSGSKRRVVMVDELPIFVLHLLRQDPNAERARRFLDWFRDLRQGPADRADPVRWILAGSIGLDAVARRHNLGSTINDLRVQGLGPFDDETASRFLVALAAGADLILDRATVRRVLDLVGPPIPFYLQVIFSALDELRPERGARTVADVDTAYASLLEPQAQLYFDPWVQRLAEELGRPQHRRAEELLTACARNPAGASATELAVLLGRHLRDPGERSRELAWLLQVLQTDGYLVLQDDRYSFRSPLIRDYWLRRFSL